MDKKVLVIDDERRMRRVLELMLSERGYRVRTAADGIQAMDIWRQWQPHVVLTDIRMPGADGMEVLDFRNREGLEAPLIILTAYGTIDMAVEAIKQGAYDYLTKPFDNDRVIRVVQRAMAESPALSGRSEKEGRMIGTCAAMQRVFKEIARVAGAPTSVLITGESGTGKELVARAIHYQGDRRQKEFVRVNCAAIPAELLESELFGHRKGAFTGAVADRKGSFLRADKGSIFLDEIGDLPMGLQPKLLHAVEEKTITPIGASRAIEVDVKVISATNRDIEQMVAEGTFRQDLFFRLNTFTIDLPPLRERRQDIAALAEHFLGHYCRQFNRGPVRLDKEALALLESYRWPGNVRQLRNVIERTVLDCDHEVVRAEDLPEDIRQTGSGRPAGGSGSGLDLEATERQLIEKALAKTGGNQARAARLLNISRNTLRYRMKKYGISRP